MAKLRISDGKEEEVMQFGGLSGGTNRLYDCCSVRSFLTASVVQFQTMCNTLANLWHPLRGHIDSFCTIKLRMDGEGLELEWDISLRAQPLRRAIVEESIWLRNIQVQASDLEMFNNMNRVLGVNLDGKTNMCFGSGGDLEEGRAKDSMIYDLEEIQIGAIDGKKRQRKNVFPEKVFEISDSEEKEGEGYLAYQKTLSTTTKGQTVYGSLSLLWKSDVIVSLRSYSSNYMGVVLKGPEDEDQIFRGWFVEILMRYFILLRRKWGLNEMIGGWTNFRRLWEGSSRTMPQRLKRVGFGLKRWATRLWSEKGDRRGYLTKRIDELTIGD
ncbi:hypothetical protein Gorai_009730 [Gossypium raimondii]|uniref:Uncharacterized protein n=1 Tax=Gossypium raimondii TaxID=29730 RepID=A0A7J8PU06_GOSRA|nr:hypothetical protein [Gossypium raimondii]